MGRGRGIIDFVSGLTDAQTMPLSGGSFGCVPRLGRVMLCRAVSCHL